MPMEQIQSVPVICKGGLNSNANWLALSAQAPGSAVDLINMEPSLYGGYRRIDGFTPLEDASPEVDSTGAEGKILGVFIFGEDILCARKQQSGATYEFYKWNVGVGWTKLTTGLTFSTASLGKIRYATYNFNGTPKIIFVDGVNFPLIYDGTTWTQIKAANDGSELSKAGGAMVIDAPSYVTIFKNTIFLAKDATYTNIIAHSAPLTDYDWTAASGAGQIFAGFEIVQIMPFRDTNFVFGATRIKKIEVNADATFVINDVTQNVGCIASDSVIEVNGDLVFLAQDGFRPISATQRNNDIELASISKSIQQDVITLGSLYNSSDINALVIRKKSQIRFFFSNASDDVSGARGFIGSIRSYTDNSVAWEWSKTLGIQASACTSGYIGNTEYVLHGDYDGKVYLQESGNTFNGEDIFAKYTTPFLDFGDTQIRKTLRSIHIFLRPEGDVTLHTRLRYDWDLPYTINPTTYTTESEGTPSIYGEAVYDSGEYGGVTIPIMVTNVQGSGKSAQLALSSQGSGSGYSIQGLVFEFSVNGQK